MKEGCDSGLWHESQNPVKPTPESSRRLNSRERDKQNNIHARIAARRAEKWWRWRQRSSENSSSDGSGAGRGTPSISRRKGSSPWATPRRYESVGIGLLNKTLRTTKKTRIPQPSAPAFRGVLGDHTQSSGASQCRTTSENYGALPSSYRRLRKAKSMMTTHHRLSGSQESPLLSPLRGTRIPRRATSFAALPTNSFRVRLKQSLTSLRPKSRVTQYTRASAGAAHDEAVRIARAQFFEEEQRRQEGRQSEATKVDLTALHRPFRKRFKTSQNLGSDGSSTPTGNGRGSILTDVGKRSFSASLRARLRRALRKTAKEKDSMPPQQLEAQRSHFGELGADTESISGFDAYCAEEENRHRRQSAYFCLTPEQNHPEDRDEMPYNLQLTASHESLHSNTRSRVTSWTNSSMTGSVGLRSGPIERNRLSIIKEDGGPHQPSSSVGRHFGGVSLFQEPIHSSTTDGHTLAPVDSQRVYSALIKRINQEEAEIERTRVAFEAINEEQDNCPGQRTDARPTIRVVHSSSSLTTMPVGNPCRQFSSHSSSENHMAGGMTPEQHKENLERRRERLAMQESQSSFFPFSSEQHPPAPSPFKRFLHDRRHDERSSNWGENTDPDGSSVVVKRDSSNGVIDRRRFGFSSDSVYSRTTNGGSNDQYRPPVGSSDELPDPANSVSEVAGMATIMASVYSRSDVTSPSAPNHLEIGQTQTSEWNPWSETLNARPEDIGNLGETHRREPALAAPEEGRRSVDVEGFPATTRPNVSYHPERPVDVGGAPTGIPSEPKIDLSAGNRRSGLLGTGRAEALSTISNQVEDGRGTTESLRKLSPRNLAKRLREKKTQVMARQDEPGKENIRADQSESPPMSTPGKKQLQFRNGNTTGRLRKRGSETAFNARKGLYSTPPSALALTSTPPSRCDESPSEKARHQLVARLSRPFNMDVPPHNRPFDSTYLGKRTPRYADTIGNSRLSVAPCFPVKADGSDTPDSGENGAGETYGIPSESSTVGRSAAKILGLFNSKRMVSNFLKSRRAERSASESGLSMARGSPAFI